MNNNYLEALSMLLILVALISVVVPSSLGLYYYSKKLKLQNMSTKRKIGLS